MHKAACFGSPDFDPGVCETRWGSLPLSMVVIEYYGNGDPAFGGQADDRVLLESGQIQGRVCSKGDAKTAVFKTVADAHQSAMKIPNRRPGSILGVAPSWR